VIRFIRRFCNCREIIPDIGSRKLVNAFNSLSRVLADYNCSCASRRLTA
jgi:hypothetical protein